MDREDALRLVVFEYLLPMQRKQRARILRRCLEQERIDWRRPSRYVAGVFEEMHWLSERLLETHGFPTSYIYPWTMRHDNEELNRSMTVKSLIDSEGPLVWNPRCPRRADPKGGIRVFRGSGQISAGRLP